jgi:CBS domain-containing protein
MRPLDHRVSEQSPLPEVLETMEKYRLERMPVVKADDPDMPAGLIEMTDLKHRVDREILRRRQSKA